MKKHILLAVTMVVAAGIGVSATKFDASQQQKSSILPTHYWDMEATTPRCETCEDDNSGQVCDVSDTGIPCRCIPTSGTATTDVDARFLDGNPNNEGSCVVLYQQPQ